MERMSTGNRQSDEAAVKPEFVDLGAPIPMHFIVVTS